MGEIKVGIIGCGGISRGHIKRLVSIPGVSVVGLADINVEAARLVAREVLGEDKDIFTDFKEMIDKVAMDAVGIFTPHTLHYEEAKYALERGLHVLVEKPMVCRVDHAKEIIGLAESKGKVLLVTYQRHYTPIYRYAKAVIDNGELGEIRLVKGLLTQDWLSIGRGSWRLDPALSGGGQLMDSGSHLLDILHWLTGLEPDEVFAFIDNKGTEVDVFTAASVKFAGGALGSLIVSGYLPAPDFHEEDYFWGTDGTMLIDRGRIYRQLKAGKVVEVEPKELPEGSESDYNFIDVIRQKDVNHSPGICGLRVAALTEAIYKSAATGQPCKVERV